jgi:hypothetical protein
VIQYVANMSNAEQEPSRLLSQQNPIRLTDDGELVDSQNFPSSQPTETTKSTEKSKHSSNIENQVAEIFRKGEVSKEILADLAIEIRKYFALIKLLSEVEDKYMELKRKGEILRLGPAFAVIIINILSNDLGTPDFALAAFAIPIAQFLANKFWGYTIHVRVEGTLSASHAENFQFFEAIEALKNEVRRVKVLIEEKELLLKSHLTVLGLTSAPEIQKPASSQKLFRRILAAFDEETRQEAIVKKAQSRLEV